MVGEPELLLAPEFFTTWAADHPCVAGLDIEVKHGVADNELNGSRYDVIIHKTPTQVRSLAAAPSWAWAQCAGRRAAHPVDIPTSHHGPHHRDPPRRASHRRPNEQALAAGVPLEDALAQASAPNPDTATPEELHRLGETTGYHVAVTWGALAGTLMPLSSPPPTPATGISHR